MSIPAVILPAVQRGKMDCGIYCLTMLLDQPFERIRDAAVKRYPQFHVRGVYASNLIRLARDCGATLEKRATWDDDDVGILDVRLPQNDRHFAVLFEGVLVNPADGMVWNLEAYLRTKRAKIRAFYAVSE